MLILKNLVNPVYDLEIHLKRKLDHAWSGARRRNLSKRQRHGDVIVRIREVGPVEKVEKLRAKFGPHSFRYGDELHD